MMHLTLICVLRFVIWFEAVEANCDDVEFNNKRDAIMKPYSKCTKKTLLSETRLYFRRRSHEDYIQLERSVRIRHARGQNPLHIAAIFNCTELASVLVDEGANVLAQDYHNYIPLQYAAWYNSVGVAEVLLRNNADKQRMALTGEYKRIALHLAAYKGSLEVARLLLQMNCSEEMLMKQLLARSRDQKTPMHYAVESNSVRVVRLILAGRKDELQQKLLLARSSSWPYGGYPMHYAVRENYIGVARVLFNSSAEVQQIQRTAIYDIVSDVPKSKHFDVAKLLIGNISVAAKEQLLMEQNAHEGITFLHRAAKQSNINVVKFLLTHVSYETALKMIKKENNAGKTPGQYTNCNLIKKVIEAFENGSRDTIVQPGQTELDNDVDNNFSLNTLLHAMSWFEIRDKSCHSAEFYDKRDVIMRPYSKCLMNISSRFLLFGPDDRDRYLEEVVKSLLYRRNTPLHIAAMYNCVELLSGLVDMGGSVLEPNTMKYIPLHYAAWYDMVAVAEILLGNNGTEQRMTRDRKGSIALHQAAARNSIGVARLLLNCSEEIRQQQLMAQVKNFNKRTPLHYAALTNAVKVARLMLADSTDELQLKLIMAQDSFNRIPLHHAVRESSVGVARVLLNLSNKMQQKQRLAADNEGNTPLHFIWRGKHLDTAELLLQNLTDAEEEQQLMAQDRNRNTPLHTVAFENKIDMAVLLLTRVSYKTALKMISKRNKYGKTAAQTARCIHVRKVIESFANCSKEYRILQTSKTELYTRMDKLQAQCQTVRSKIYNKFPTKKLCSTNDDVNKYRMRLSEVRKTVKHMLKLNENARKLIEEARKANEEARSFMEKALESL